MKDLNQTLHILSDWLINSDSNIDPYYDGILETAIKYSKQDTKIEIGQMIQEILNMDENSINSEVERINTPKSKLPF